MPTSLTTSLLSGVQAVFFDAVGTLIVPKPSALQVYFEVARRHGSRLTSAEIAVRFRGAFAEEETKDRDAGWVTSEKREEERWRGIVARTLSDVSPPESCFEELFAHFSRPEAWRCDPEADATLATLRRHGLLTGVASNFDGRLRKVLAGLTLNQTVDHFVVSSEIGWRKPARAFFDALARQSALAAHQILYVGDDPVTDFDGGIAAGVNVALFDPENRFGSLGPRIAGLSDIVAALR